MIKEKMIEKLVEKGSIVVDSGWLKKNDEDLYYYLKEKLQSFVADKANTADEENMKLFEAGEYLIELVFDEGGTRVYAGETQQVINNQPPWSEDSWEDWETEMIEKYYWSIQ